VNDCDLLVGFFDFRLPLSKLTLSIFSSYCFHILYGKTRLAGLQSGEGRMVIDVVVWTQYINVTDTQTDRQTDSHVAIENAAPTHCVERQKWVRSAGKSLGWLGLVGSRKENPWAVDTYLDSDLHPSTPAGVLGDEAFPRADHRPPCEQYTTADSDLL